MKIEFVNVYARMHDFFTDKDITLASPENVLKVSEGKNIHYFMALVTDPDWGIPEIKELTWNEILKHYSGSIIED